MVRLKHTSILKKCPVLKYMLIIIVWSVFPSAVVKGAECISETYGQASFEKPQAAFSPYERVFVKISCEALDAGDHTLYINWVHQQAGIVLSDKKGFYVQQAGAGHTAYFWFKLTRLGPIKSTLSNRDFYPGHLGEWYVEIFLAEKSVSTSSFSISENY